MFTVDAGLDYGNLQRMSVGYSRKGSLFGALGDAWLLDSVEVFDHVTSQKSFFKFGVWIDKSKPRVEMVPTTQEGGVQVCIGQPALAAAAHLHPCSFPAVYCQGL